jgi:hypothetical protein
MGIDVIKQPDDELLLTDAIEDGAETQAGDAADTVAGAEAIDEIEYPDKFDDEMAGDETPLMKHLREKAKQDAREKAELRRENEALRNKAAPASKPEPDLWDDCEGDPDKFKAALLEWQENERQVAESAKKVDTGREAAIREWQGDLQSYQDKKAKLARPDFADAESQIIATMTDAQQSTIIMAAKDPARFIYALGRSPNRLAQLAEITNPIKLAAEVARIEGARIMPRKEPANVDTPLKGGARLSNVPKDEKEDALIKEAQRTGDATKLRDYRRAQKQAA